MSSDNCLWALVILELSVENGPVSLTIYLFNMIMFNSNLLNDQRVAHGVLT